jgi:hypothetical protein
MSGNGGCSNSGSSSEPSINIGLTRVCSVMRSAIPYPQFIFFEEAKNPILSVEAQLPNDMMACESNRMQYAAAGYYPPSYRPSPYQIQPGSSSSGSALQVTSTGTVVLASVSLQGVNLFNGPFSENVPLNVAAIDQQFAGSLGNLLVSVRVCDDTNHNGICSDEAPNDILSVSAPSFSLNHVPSSLDVEVWNGRNLNLQTDPEICDKQYSPLILDLTGQGFTLSGLNNPVSFDLNATGTPVFTGWTAAKNVAFLVRDLNHNGKIDNGRELFGSATVLSNGMLAANGFEALKDLDSNNDGYFSPLDVAWPQVQLWIDYNHNGITDPGELISLDAAGIQNINLNYVDVMEVDPQGNTTRERSVFHRLGNNGQSVPLQIIDIWFDTIAE